jgi:hypothetical protein
VAQERSEVGTVDGGEAIETNTVHGNLLMTTSPSANNQGELKLKIYGLCLRIEDIQFLEVCRHYHSPLRQM